MAFKIEKFGAEVSNAKSILGGISYYRYAMTNDDDITTAGYFPSKLGLKEGDRIWVTPKTKTNADALYIVSSVSDAGVVTVVAAQSGSSVSSTTVTLAAADWADSAQTVDVADVTADSIVIVAPIPADQSDYTAAGILCTAQADGELTFTCDNVPANDIDVSVVIL